MIDKAHLLCCVTGETYPVSQPRWRSDSGGLLDIDFTPCFSRAEFERRPPGLWRYRAALPIERDDSIVTLGEPATPLQHDDSYGRPAWLKLDYLHPTGSYKDRGASVLLSKVRELGVRRIVEDSSGNAGAAIAAYAARAGVACEIYVPESASGPKLAQIAACGATLHRIPGPRQAAADACRAAAETTYYASHCWNPFFLQGTKTCAYEVAEQLDWQPPDAVVLPAGNGTLLLGMWKGFSELHAAGLIARRPRLFGVQAAACAPLTQSADSLPKPTLAEGIAVVAPVRGAQILAAIQQSGGQVLTVGEPEIRTALQRAWRRGLFIEPTAAVALAALPQIPQALAKLVVPLTGSGLKLGAAAFNYFE